MQNQVHAFVSITPPVIHAKDVLEAIMAMLSMVQRMTARSATVRTMAHVFCSAMEIQSVQNVLKGTQAESKEWYIVIHSQSFVVQKIEC